MTMFSAFLLSASSRQRSASLLESIAGEDGEGPLKDKVVCCEWPPPRRDRKQSQHEHPFWRAHTFVVRHTRGEPLDSPSPATAQAAVRPPGPAPPSPRIRQP